MVLDQYGRSVVRVDLADVKYLIYYHITCLQLILSLNLSLSHIARARYVLVEIVSMCGSYVGNVTAGLRKGCCIGGVGVYHALYVGECPVQYKVSPRER